MSNFWERRGPLWLAAFGVLALCGLAVLLFAPPSGRGPSLPAAPQQPAREVTLYLAAAGGEYAQQAFPVPQRATEEEQIRAVLERLAAQPEKRGDASLWPFPLRLRALYLRKNGLLILDLEDAVQYNQAAGAEAELLAVRSLVHTLTQNFPRLRAVKFLKNGSEQETLAGHVDISRPLSDEDVAP